MPEEAQPPQIIKPPRHGSKWWLFIAAIAVLVAGLAFWLWVDSLQNQQADDDAISVYKNTEYGFELKYPTEAQFINNGTEFVFTIPGSVEDSGINLTILAFPEIGERPLTDQVGVTLVENPEQLVWTPATLAGRAAMSTRWNTTAGSGESHQVHVLDFGSRGYAVFKHIYDSPGSTALE